MFSCFVEAANRLLNKNIQNIILARCTRTGSVLKNDRDRELPTLTIQAFKLGKSDQQSINLCIMKVKYIPALFFNSINTTWNTVNQLYVYSFTTPST